MNRVFYDNKMTFLPGEIPGTHILFLNEEEGFEPRETETDTPEQVSGFYYTGPRVDGGTTIEAVTASRDAFVSGLVCREYSADAVEAIVANYQIYLTNKKHERAADFKERWDEFQGYREECKSIADSFFPEETQE